MVEYIELKDIKKDKGKAKKAELFKAIGKGARSTAKRVGTGARVAGAAVIKQTGGLIKKAKEAQSPEARERRLEAQEKRLIVKERLAQRRARIRKLQPTGGSAFGFQSMDMGRVLSGGGDAPSGGGLDVGGNLSGAFGAISGTQPKSTVQKVAKRFRTIKTTKRIRIKKGKRKGKFRTRTTKKRVAIKQKAVPSQPQAFDPFSQF